MSEQQPTQPKQKLRVAYLGPEGTYTNQAAKKEFPDAELCQVVPIHFVVSKVETGEFDLGVVPFENVYDGPIMETIDALTECHDARIVGEVYMQIVHCMGVMPGCKNISVIYSKDTALGQCGRYLRTKYPHASTLSTSSTVIAANRVRSEDSGAAAIASREALTGLDIIAEDIAPNNRTRFAVIGREGRVPSGEDKTFVVLCPPGRDKPGVLYDLLEGFKKREINLENIFSRPDGAGGYRFYAEIKGHKNDPNVREAIDAAGFAKILGSYQDSHWKDFDRK